VRAGAISLYPEFEARLNRKNFEKNGKNRISAITIEIDGEVPRLNFYG
jgi:hypothetical protein